MTVLKLYVVVVLLFCLLFFFSFRTKRFVVALFSRLIFQLDDLMPSLLFFVYSLVILNVIFR